MDNGVGYRTPLSYGFLVVYAVRSRVRTYQILGGVRRSHGCLLPLLWFRTVIAQPVLVLSELRSVRRQGQHPEVSDRPLAGDPRPQRPRKVHSDRGPSRRGSGGGADKETPDGCTGPMPCIRSAKNGTAVMITKITEHCYYTPDAIDRRWYLGALSHTHDM